MNLRDWTRRTQAALQADPTAAHDLSQAQIDAVLRAAISTLIHALLAGDDLRLKALGRFYTETRPPRRLTSGLDQTRHALPARRRVRFQPSESLRDRLR